MSEPRIEPLLPERYPDHDLFICDVGDAVLKDTMQHMEHPFYSLSKKPDMAIRRYEHRDKWIQIVPSYKGIATIYDKDILIFCISKIINALNEDKTPSRRVRISANELLMFTNRSTGGREYASLLDGLERLQGTQIKTNIEAGNATFINGFGLIDAYLVKRQNGLNGRIEFCEITLSEWVFSAIAASEVLTLHRDYFRLRKPLERRVYEIARKHCGTQPVWRIGLETLHKKSGSKSHKDRFKYMVKELADNDHLPDYHVTLEDDKVVFRNRGSLEPPAKPIWEGPLSPEAYEDARNHAPGYDIYVIEREWREWLAENEMIPQNPDKHFVKFCITWFEKRGAP